LVKFFKLIKLFFYILKYKNPIFFVYNNNLKEIDFSKLLYIKKKKHLIIYKSKPAYNQGLINYNKYNEKILCTNYFFLFIFLTIIKSTKTNILFVSQPYYALAFLFSCRNFFLYAYDIHKGLLDISRLKVFAEFIVIIFFKKFIHRDLRLFISYKKIIKNKTNIFIPDFIFQTKIIKQNKFIKKDSKKLHCALLGWIDDKNVTAFKSIKKLCDLKVHVDIFITNNSLKHIEQKIQSMQNLYPQYINIKKDFYGKKLEAELNKCHFGLCPHDKSKPAISNNYRKYCSSARVIEYLKSKLVIFLSDKATYQNFIIRKYNGTKFSIKYLHKIKKSSALVNLAQKKKNCDIKTKSNIFNEKYLSRNLYNFLKN
jgi:hypothetical protein